VVTLLEEHFVELIDERREDGRPLAPAAPIAADGSPAAEGIFVYGADWCGDTRRSRALLDRLGLAYTYVDVDEHPLASAWAAAQNGGQRRIPVVVLPTGGAGGPTLIEPIDDALLAALAETGYLDAPVIGPALVGAEMIAAH
jgi:mycoredoxin